MSPYFMLLLSVCVLCSNVSYIYPVWCLVEIKLFVWPNLSIYFIINLLTSSRDSLSNEASWYHSIMIVAMIRTQLIREIIVFFMGMGFISFLYKHNRNTIWYWFVDYLWILHNLNTLDAFVSCRRPVLRRRGTVYGLGDGRRVQE